MSSESKPQNYDELAWQILNENRWRWNGYDEKEDIVWPCNRSEIKATRKGLKKIDENQISHEEVLKEYKLQKGLCDSIEKELPNNRLKMIFPLLVMLGVIYFVFWYNFPPKESHYTAEDWIVNVNTALVSSSEKEPTLDRASIKIPKGTAVTPIGMGENRHVKVKLPTGEIGFVHIAAFSGIDRKNEIVKNTRLYSLSKTDKEIGRIEKNMPQILDVPFIDDENNRLIKVRTTSGKRGFIYDNNIRYHFADSILDLSTEVVIPVASTRALKWKGKGIESLEKKYGQPDAIINLQAYWDNLRIIGDTLAYRGLIANINKEGIIDSVQFGKEENLFASMSFFPLWRMLASVEPFYDLIDWDFEQNDRVIEIQWWENLRSKHWIFKILVWIVELIFKVLMFILMLSMFFLPVMALGIILSHLESISFDTAKRITFWLTIAVLISIGIFTLLQGDFQVIMMILLAIAAGANYFAFWMYLGDKCRICGNWDGEITEKTDFLGHSISVQYGTRDKYMGSDRRLKSVSSSINENKTTYTYQTTHKYKRIRTMDTYEYDNYKDHKMCKNCGVRWTEKFRILRKEKHQDL